MFKDTKYPQLFEWFYRISQIPRGSGNEKAIADFLEEFAKKRKLFCYRDEVNNILIRKEATSPKLKNAPAVVLQGHTDMVCEADAGVEHDFLKDPIKFVRNGDILTADGTTLGADNGCAVAAMLTILDSDSYEHPELECLFTVGEEVGMDGMNAFDTSLLKARQMLNLDSAGEGIATVSCAGGVRCDFSRKFEQTALRENDIHFELKISGLYGGHSGEDINLGRANAVEICARFLRAFENLCEVRLISITGGDKDNAIPRECRAVFAVPSNADLSDTFKSVYEFTKHELVTDDKNYNAELIPTEVSKSALGYCDTKTVTDFLSLFRSGPVMMSRAVAEMVESSYNLAVVKLNEDSFSAVVSFRSSEEASLDDLTLKMHSIGRITGFNVNCHGRYPGWKYAEVSPMRDKFLKVWKETFGAEGTAIGIHAGLECGLLLSRVPDMDIISIGPDIKDLHSPSESLGIASFDRFFETVIKILEIC